MYIEFIGYLIFSNGKVIQMAQIRKYAADKFATVFNIPVSDKLCQNLEKCIFNWAVKKTRSTGDQPSWENHMFKERYKQKFLFIHYNLKDPTNEITNQLISGKVPVTEIVYMMPAEINPTGPHAVLLDKMKIVAMHKESVNSVDDSYEGVFKCAKCKLKKTSYYQMQTRSADEPMTTFVSCINCGNRWKF